MLASALYTMTAGVALLVQGLRSSKRAISPQGTTPLSRNERKLLGCQAQAHKHLTLIYDNHTRLELEKIGRPGTRNLLDSCVCVKVVLPSSLYRPWRRAYRYGPDTGGSIRTSRVSGLTLNWC